MPRSRSSTLTDAELRLMRVLWGRGPSTVADVVAALPDDDKVSYSTVLTILRILEGKGYLRHRQQGRAYLYEPVVDRDQAQRSILRRIIGQFFGGSPGALALNVLEHEQLTQEEVERLRELIDRKEEEER